MVGMPHTLYRTRSSARFSGYERDLHAASANYIRAMFECSPPAPSSDAPSKPAPAWPSPASPPVPPAAAAATLANFIARTLHHAQVPLPVVLAALVYLARLKLRFPLSKGASGSRLFLAALVLAQKFLCDGPYSSRTWVRIVRGYYALDEVVQMERELLDFVGWDLGVTEQQLFAVEELIMSQHLHPFPLATVTPPPDEAFLPAHVRPAPPAPVPVPRSHSSSSVVARAPVGRASKRQMLASSASLDALAQAGNAYGNSGGRRVGDISTTPLVGGTGLHTAPSSAAASPAMGAPPEPQATGRKRSAALALLRSRSPVTAPAVPSHHRQRHRRPSASPVPPTFTRRTHAGPNPAAPDLLSNPAVAPPVCCAPSAFPSPPQSTSPTVPPPARASRSRSSSNLFAADSIAGVNFSRPMRSLSSTDLSAAADAHAPPIPAPAAAAAAAPISTSSSTSTISSLSPIADPLTDDHARSTAGKKGARSAGAIASLLRGWR